MYRSSVVIVLADIYKHLSGGFPNLIVRRSNQTADEGGAHRCTPLVEPDFIAPVYRHQNCTQARGFTTTYTVHIQDLSALSILVSR